jgi:hypothetical protein
MPSVDIYLGLSGAEVTLPPINWQSGSAPSLPTDTQKNVEWATMSDGSTRANIKGKHPKKWTLGWYRLSAADLAIIVAICERNVRLHFQNNWLDSTWRWVVVESYPYEPIPSTFATGAKFWSLTLTLAEVV